MLRRYPRIPSCTSSQSMPVSRSQPEVLPEQMLMARNYGKLLFSPAASVRAAA